MALLAATAWFALVLQFYIMLNNPAPGFSQLMLVANFFSFFTILSNLLVAVCLTACFLIPQSAAGKFFQRAEVKSAIAVYIFIVGLVYNIVLRKLWSPAGWQLVVDNLLHIAVPVLYVLYWYFFERGKKLKWKHLFYWLIFPAAYLIYTLIRGAMVNWYPYPFVDAGNIGYAKVAVNSLGVLAAILIVGSLILLLNKSSKPLIKS